jgi:hypothetical protein
MSSVSLGRLLLACFIGLTLTLGSLAGSNDPNLTLSLGEDHQEQATQGVVANQDLALLAKVAR